MVATLRPSAGLLVLMGCCALAALHGCGNNAPSYAAGDDASALPPMSDAVDAASDVSATSADTTGSVVPTGPSCKTHKDCGETPATPYCLGTQKVCVECITTFMCNKNGGDAVCVDFQCKEVSCVPGATSCKNGFVQTCNAAGKGFELAACPDSAPTCVQGSCRVCTPDARYCAKESQPGDVLQCSSTGEAAQVVDSCSKDEVCVGGECRACVPGAKSCHGSVVMACDTTGGALIKEQDCAAAGLLCLAGVCVDPCAGDLKSNTHAGCRYWAVDLDNAVHQSGGQTFDAQNMQFAVIVSNTVGLFSGVSAKVTVRYGPHIKIHTVAPGNLTAIKLPDPSWQLSAQSLDGTMVANRGFELSSNIPIIAYQFNPLENYGVFSNDASLLLPEHVLGSDYLVMTRRQNFAAHPGYVTVVGAGTQGKEVTVKVTTSAPTLPGPGVPGLAAGESYTVKLAPGAVLNLESGAIGADLTGTRVQSDGPVAVFAGSEAANVPEGNECVKPPGATVGKCAQGGWPCDTIAQCPVTCCADHIEQQLFPISAWGKTYVATKLKPRGAEPDVWRILAAQDGTSVTTSPPQAPNKTLQAGEYFEFESKEDFVIQADKPVLVGQFMASANAPNPNNDTCSAVQAGQKLCATYLQKTGKAMTCASHTDCPNIPEATDAKIGDPAFVLTVANQRWLTEYVFLTPDKYSHSFVNIAKPKGAVVHLDGQQLQAKTFSSVAGGEFEVARVQVPAGGHIIKATQAVGVSVYGWDKYVSYAYPAGASF